MSYTMKVSGLSILAFYRAVIVLLFLESMFMGCLPPFQSEDNSKDQENLLLFTAIALSQASCPVGNGGFWSIDFSTGDDICVSVEQKAIGNRVRIWEERGLNRIRQANQIQDPNYTAILESLEAEGLPKLFAATGEPSDINRDGRVDIVILNLSKYSGGGSFIAGYFYPLDLFRSEGGLISNQREVIFIDGILLANLSARSLKRERPFDMLGVIAHEMQHLIRFPYEIGRAGQSSPIPLPRTNAELNQLLNTDSLWINEGTSELASDIAGYGPQSSRLECLRRDPGYGCSQGIQGKSLYQFANRIIDYSMSYAWMSYLYHNAGDSLESRNRFLKQTIQSGNVEARGRNINSLLNAYKSSDKYLANTDAGEIFASVTTNEQIFQRLQAGFLGNFFKYPVNDVSTTAIFGTGPTPTNVNISGSGGGNNLLSVLSYPTTLQGLVNQPSTINIIDNNPNVFELQPAQMYRVSGSVPSFTQNNPNISLVIKGTPPAEYTIFNTKLDEKEGFAIARQFDRNKDPNLFLHNSKTKSNLKDINTSKNTNTNHSQKLNNKEEFRRLNNLLVEPSIELPRTEKVSGVFVREYLNKKLVWELLESGLISE